MLVHIQTRLCLCWRLSNREIGLGVGVLSPSWRCRRTARGLGSPHFLPQTVVFLYFGPTAWTWLISSHAHSEQCSHCAILSVCIYTLHIHNVCVCVCPDREGIQWEAIDWMDNAECLDLIEKVRSHHQDRPLTTSQSASTQTPHCAHTDPPVSQSIII